MSYFSNEYLRLQLERLHRASITRLIKANNFLRRDQPLYVLSVDVKRSTELPALLRTVIVGHINLIVVTDIMGRGGAMVGETDGIDAFFWNAQAAIRSGMSIYHHKRQVQERILQPIVQDYQRHVVEPTLDYRDIDYRVLLVELPLAQKNDTVTRNMTDPPAAIKDLTVLWNEAKSRYGNKESFLISKQMYDRLLAEKATPLLRYFDETSHVPLVPLKVPVPRIEAFFKDGFHKYSNPSVVHIDIETTSGDKYTSGGEMDADMQSVFHAQKRNYHRRIGYETRADSDAFLFDYFKIERMKAPRQLPGAVVLGDINLDFVTYLKSGDVGALTSNKSHIQLRQDIQKVVAGKAVNIAIALEDTKRFDSILLLGKLGMDIEMSHIVQELRSHKIIKPVLFLSNSLPTGTSISVRRFGDNRSLVTITDKPNANSELVVEEVQAHFKRLRRAEYLFISGYCLLDDRFIVVRALIDEFRKSPGNRVVLEFSPAHLLRSYFSESEGRVSQLRQILKDCFLVAYEEGAFPNEEIETQLLSEVPYKLRFTTGIHQLFERPPRSEWRLATQIEVSPEGSLGLVTRVMAQYMSEKFLKPRLLLCSSSPRRYELLVGLYGHSAVYHLRDLASPEFERMQYQDHKTLVTEFLRITVKKLILGMQKLSESLDGREFDLCRVALSSDLVVVGSGPTNECVVLDKPDDSDDPIEKELEILTEWLSGKSHFVWTCTCFLEFRGFVNQNGQWNRERFVATDQALINYIGSLNDLSKVDGIIGNFEPTKNPAATYHWSENLTLTAGDSLQLKLLLSSSRVTFDKLSEAEIEEYLSCGEWRTKGGGYAIQGCASYFVRDIEGSITNIVGLPMKNVDAILKDSFKIQPRM